MTGRRASTDATWELLGSLPPDAREAPLLTVRRVLRGRLRIAAIAATIVGTLGAIVGYHAKPLRFVSAGLVQIEGALTPILYQTEENRIPPMFETFVAAQEAFLGSRRVLDAAVAAPEMHDVGWPTGADGVAALQRGLKITRGRRENLIAVTVTDGDPRRAQVAVNAVLAGFERNVVDPTTETISAKERTLIDRQEELERRIRVLREQVLDISHQYGSEAINRMHAARVQELLALEQQIAALDAAGSTDVTPDAADRMAAFEAQELDIAARLTGLRERYGPNHPIIVRLEGELDAIRATKAARVRAPAADDPRRDDLRRQYVARDAVLRSEIERLGRQIVEITEIEARIHETSDLLWATRRRIDEIRVESRRDDMNRITIAARGDLPVAPVSDRRAVLTAAGFAFGGFAGVGMVFLFGLVDPRARYLEELTALETAAPVLGAIPQIDEARPAAAAPFVHQLRNLLELKSPDPGRNVFVVTSAERGEGRTSVSLALASSFAAAGRRTLVVDADLGRAALTRELDLVGRPGLCDALTETESLTTHATDREGVRALPSGTRNGFNAADLSHPALARLLDRLREDYEAIVVDTGSVLASVETCAVCAAGDTVIMTVARGRRLTRVRAALDRLAQADVACAGLVLNRACVADAGGAAGGPAAGATRVAALMEPASGPTRVEGEGPIASIAFAEDAGERNKAA